MKQTQADYEGLHWARGYLLFQYGKPEELLPNFDSPLKAALHFLPKCVELCESSWKQVRGDDPVECALDIGCAVGRASFDLAKFSKSVIGIDLDRKSTRLNSSHSQI